MPPNDNCAVCRRAPLVGETVSIVSVWGSEAAVCDLCTDKPRALNLGPAVRRERVRSAEGSATVHRTLPVHVRVAAPVRPARAA